MKYIAINLKDFHHQQDAGATCRIKFVSARNIKAAQKHMKRWHSEYAWAIITKRTFDANIVHRELANN